MGRRLAEHRSPPQNVTGGCAIRPSEATVEAHVGRVLSRERDVLRLAGDERTNADHSADRQRHYCQGKEDQEQPRCYDRTRPVFDCS
jgi:hypothetical protein